MQTTKDYVAELFDLASPLFLFLVSFRRKVQKGYQVSEAMVKSDLEKILLEIEKRSRRDPRLDSLYTDAKYPLTVLADEVLLNSDWEHAQSWQSDYLLEQQFFGSNTGGDKIFNIASELEFSHVELAAILFTTICLGVKGTFHRKPEKLKEVRGKLYNQISEYLADVKGQLTPSAYTVMAKNSVRFSPAITLVRVILVGLGLVVLYWVAARLSWSVLLGDLRTLVEQLVTG